MTPTRLRSLLTLSAIATLVPLGCGGGDQGIDEPIDLQEIPTDSTLDDPAADPADDPSAPVVTPPDEDDTPADPGSTDVPVEETPAPSGAGDIPPGGDEPTGGGDGNS